MGSIMGFIGGQISGFREKFYPKKEPSVVESKYDSGTSVPESIPKPEYTIVPSGFVKPTPYVPSYTPEVPYIRQQPLPQPTPGFISGQIIGFQEIFTEKGRAQVLAREREARYEQLGVQISEQNASINKYEKMVDKDDMFTGSDAEYAAYSRIFDKHKRDVNEYNEIAVKINRKIEEEEVKRKAQFFGARGKAEEAYERGEKWVTPRVQKLLPEWSEQVKTRFYRPYEAWSPGEKEILAGMDPLTQYLAKSPTYFKVRTALSEPMFGFYKETREQPLRQILTTATFIALPPVLKGVSKIGKVTGLAPKTLGGFLPKWTGHIPKAAAYGMGTVYTGSIGYELYKTPAGLRSEQFGRIAARDIVPMMVGTYVGIKGVPILAKEARLFPKEFRRMLISKEARLDPMRALKKRWALEQAGTEAKFLSGEWRPIETRGGIMVQKMIPKLLGKAKVKVGHRRPRIQTITTTRVKELAVGRAARRKVRRKRVTKKSERALRAIEQERARMVKAQRDPLKEIPVIKQITKPITRQKLRIGQISKLEYYPILAPISLILQKQLALQEEIPIAIQKEALIEDIIGKEVYKDKEEEKYAFKFPPIKQYIAKEEVIAKEEAIKKAKKKVIKKIKRKPVKKPKKIIREKIPLPFILSKPKKKKKLTKAQIRKLRQRLVINPIKTPLEVLKWRF